jgi:folylpolyglutamate synthase/dihydropteroate synthase
MQSFSAFLQEKLRLAPERAPGRQWNLGPMRTVMERTGLGRVKLASQIVSIVGSNGKGSCGYLLASSLQNSGKRVAFVSSPHVLNYRERLRINGLMLSEALWDACYQKVSTLLSQLSYYESIMFISFLLVQEHNIDVLVLEAGLGGRYDAINVLDADVLMVSTIDLEHMDYLGDTREKIFFEKIQVARSNTQVFANIDEISWVEKARQDIGFIHQPLQMINVPLIKGVSPALLSLVANVLQRFFAIDDFSLMPTSIPYRSQIIAPGPVVIDTAHNVPAACNLMKQLVQDLGHEKWDVYCNQKTDRDLVLFLQALMPWVKAGHICTAPGLHPRQQLPIHLADWQWLEASKLNAPFPNRPAVVFGSFYLLQYLTEHLALS